MSGFVALFNPDGAPVEEYQLLDMMAAMAHRGPDGRELWYEGNVGLGVLFNRTTPQSRFDRLLPPETEGRIVIAADARLDNREELLAILRPRVAEVGDAALIALAYEKWGESCAEHLIGDFAFALWDRTRKSFLAARDHIGVRPFYYHRSSTKGFAAASTIGAVFAGRPAIARTLNVERIAQYLTGVFDDVEHTFYSTIHRLPPSHFLSLAHARPGRYARLEPGPELRLSSDREYAEAFRDLFAETVRCRLQSTGPVAAALSGGLDSSSVVCAARALRRESGGEPIATYSLVFDAVPESDERAFIGAVVEEGGLRSAAEIHADEVRPLPEIATFYHHLEEPFYAPNMALHWTMFGAAREAGMRVWLDGLDGDTTVSHGIAFLAELARSLRWVTLRHEVAALAEHQGIDRRRLFRSTVLNPLLDPLRAMRGKDNGGDAWRETAIAPALAQRVWPRGMDREERPRTAQEDHLRRLRWGLHPYLLESLDRAASAFALEPRYPFYDRRLIEFCLALPSDLKLRDGWTRWVLREAMEGILPEKIRWRTDKGNPGPSFIRSLRLHEGERLRRMVASPSSELAEYVDLAKLRLYLDRFMAGGTNEREVLELWKALTLATWLERRMIG